MDETLQMMPQIQGQPINPNQPMMPPQPGQPQQPMQLQYNPDGSVLVFTNQVPEEPEPQQDDNLAFMLKEEQLYSIGTYFKAAIEADKDTMQDFSSNLAATIKLLGINASANSDIDVDSFAERYKSVYSPALAETLWEFTATVMNSIFPTKDPVTCTVLGQTSDDMDNAATRKAEFFNSYLRYKDEGFYKELRRSVIWSIIAGSIYVKVYIDPIFNRPTMKMIQPEDFILNQEASTHHNALRKTQVHRMSAQEFKVKMKKKEFKNIDFKPTNIADDEDSNNPVAEITNEINSLNNTYYNSEYNEPYYKIYECHALYHLKGDPLARNFDDIPLPYIFLINADNGRVLSIKRNWSASDPLKQKQEYYANFSFLPSLKGEGYGLVQTSGALASTATDILRQLLVAGSYASYPAGFVQDQRLEASNVNPAPGQFMPVRSGPVPLSQAIFPLPFKEPSPTLFELKNQLEDSIRKPAAILSASAMQQGANTPAITTLVQLDQTQKVSSFILQNYHQSFCEVLGMFNNRFYEWLPSTMPYPFKVAGQDMVIMKQDFNPTIAVKPSINPELQSGPQRMLRAQLLLQTAMAAPQLHNLYNVQKYFYKNMNISDDDITNLMSPDPTQPPPPPPMLDPVSENQRMTIGQPVKAYLQQDHMSHMAVHQQLLGQMTQQQDPSVGAIQSHIHEHMAMQMQVEFTQQTGIQIPEDPIQLPPEAQQQIAIAAAEIAKQQQQNQQQQPNPDVMNAQAAMMVAEAEQQMVGVKSQQAQLEAQVKQQQLMLDEKKLELEYLKLQADKENKQQKLELDTLASSKKVESEAAKNEAQTHKLDLETRKIGMDIFERSQNIATQMQQKVDRTADNI
jgi:hypothetical protein